MNVCHVAISNLGVQHASSLVVQQLTSFVSYRSVGGQCAEQSSDVEYVRSRYIKYTVLY